MLETSNLVNPFPTNPTLMGHPGMAGPATFKFPSNTISDNLPNPHAFNFGQMSAGQFDSRHDGSIHHVTRGTVVTQAMPKDVTPNRKDSDEVSSDHMSLNNMNHLRRGYVAPVNSGCVSEADYTMLPAPGHLVSML
jgi:hypothetical protein